MKLFIVNPISGKGNKDNIISKLRQKGYDIALTEYAGHAEEIARTTEADIVVAVGGDGTVNEVARGLIGTDKIFGIIPSGSGDGLARHIGISHNLENALKVIEGGKVCSIDAGKVNGRMFFSLCGVGFDAIVSEKFAMGGKRGLINYLKIGFRTWHIYKPESYTIYIDGEKIQTDAMFVAICNSSQWGNGAQIAPTADISDGLLEVTIVERFSNFELPVMLTRLMTGRVHKSSHVKIYQGKKIKLVRNAEGPAHTDGDWFHTGTELNAEIIPGALKVLVP